MIDSFVNTAILGNPINWLIVVTILIFVFYAAFVIWSNAGGLSQLLPTHLPDVAAGY